MNLESHLKSRRKNIDQALAGLLPKSSRGASSLYEAMRYAVLSGGKRIRPIPAIESALSLGGSLREVMPAACAIEFIHSYSLVHDDLPCMDNDFSRRGKPSCHAKYGQDIALLAGDALLTLAFKVMADVPDSLGPQKKIARLKAAQLLAEASGAPGMVSGQAMDIRFKESVPDLPALECIHTHKTGALIASSTKIGACLALASQKEVSALYRYGQALGYLFQIVDDILDGDGYVKIMGPGQARREAAECGQRARESVRFLGRKGEILSKIVDAMEHRKN